jgi:hypothetical protein
MLKDVKGLGPKSLQKLQEAGILTLEALAIQDPKVMAERSGLPEGTGNRFITEARLMLKERWHSTSYPEALLPRSLMFQPSHQGLQLSTKFSAEAFALVLFTSLSDPPDPEKPPYAVNAVSPSNYHLTVEQSKSAKTKNTPFVDVEVQQFGLIQKRPFAPTG